MAPPPHSTLHSRRFAEVAVQLVGAAVPAARRRDQLVLGAHGAARAPGPAQRVFAQGAHQAVVQPRSHEQVDAALLHVPRPVKPVLAPSAPPPLNLQDPRHPSRLCSPSPPPSALPFRRSLALVRACVRVLPLLFGSLTLRCSQARTLWHSRNLASSLACARLSLLPLWLLLLTRPTPRALSLLENCPRYYVKHHSLPPLMKAGLKHFKVLIFDEVPQTMAHGPCHSPRLSLDCLPD